MATVFQSRQRRKTQKSRLDAYQEELQRSRRWRDNVGYDDVWREQIGLYRGDSIFPAGVSSEDRISVNIAFSTLNVIFPSVSVTNPKILVLPTKPDTEARSVFVEAILNYYWEHYGFHEPFRRAVKDFLTVGHGWCKVMWNFSEVDRELSEEEFQQAFARVVEQQLTNPEMEQLSDEEIAQGLLDNAGTVTRDQPIVQRVSPFDMFVNPEATDMDDARWVCQRVVRRIEEIRGDKNYSRTAREKVQAGLQLRGESDDRYDHENVDPELAEVWEFYDLVEETMCVFAPGSEEYLIKPRPLPFAFGHPYVMIRNYDVPDEFYPMGDLEQIAPLVKELSKTRSEMMNHRAKYARKYLARKRAIARGDIDKITSRKDGQVVFVEDDNTPLNDVIIPIPQVGMDPGLYNWSAQIEDDINEVSGVSEFARGSAPSIRRTATEASLIQDATNARSADKLARVEDFISRIGKRLLQVTQQFLTAESVARVVGRDGASIWVPYTRSDIEGEFDFRVEAGSTQPSNESFRRQQALALAQVALPFVEAGIANPQELFRHLLKDGFGIANPEKFMAQQQQAAGPEEAEAAGGQGADAPQPTSTARADAGVADELQPSVDDF
jgi:Na+-transporting NADH:ubiquinone oxidoreductase subunit NqrC